jgi:hypothetical protein
MNDGIDFTPNHKKLQLIEPVSACPLQLFNFTEEYSKETPPEVLPELFNKFRFC